MEICKMTKVLLPAAVQYVKERQMIGTRMDAAEIGGIADRVGSLTPGKDADLVVFPDSPFEVMSSPALVMIDGKIVRRERG